VTMMMPIFDSIGNWRSVEYPIRSPVPHILLCIDRFSGGQPSKKNYDRPRCNRIFEIRNGRCNMPVNDV
jgi:hypothetical protein